MFEERIVKIQLLNDNGYSFLSLVKFPVEVACIPNTESQVFIRCDELLRIGATPSLELGDPEFVYGFSDYELIK